MRNLLVMPSFYMKMHFIHISVVLLFMCFNMDVFYISLKVVTNTVNTEPDFINHILAGTLCYMLFVKHNRCDVIGK